MVKHAGSDQKYQLVLTLFLKWACAISQRDAVEAQTVQTREYERRAARRGMVSTQESSSSAQAGANIIPSDDSSSAS